MIPTLDAIEVFTKLRKDFPHVQFIIVDEVHGLNLREVQQRFMLVKFGNNVFVNPVKTNIVFRNKQYIVEYEYQKIYEDMLVSFNINKLIGLI